MIKMFLKLTDHIFVEEISKKIFGLQGASQIKSPIGVTGILEKNISPANDGQKSEFLAPPKKQQKNEKIIFCNLVI